MTMNQAPFIAISRHRIQTDGEGVTTLCGFYGCPLRCKYCINPQSFRDDTKKLLHTPESLYNAVKLDDIYFLATNGGVTFGGGEPLCNRKGDIIGALGVSGGSESEDTALAAYGKEIFEKGN